VLAVGSGLGPDIAKKSVRARLAALLKVWIETRVLVKKLLPFGMSRKSVHCIVAGPNNTAETEQ
jgi:hypothetical protein